MIVDDNAYNRLAIKRIALLFGEFTFFEAENG